MDLLALADFVLVARHGGFGRAARASGRPKATLSRRVAELEAALALRLFERGGRDLKCTEEGRALYSRAAALLTELDETVAAIASGGREVRGRLRISAPLLFAQAAMGRLAAEFVRRHPAVQLEVTSEDRPVDMIEEGYDLAIRVDPDPDDQLVGRAFLHDRLLVVASPALARPADGAPVPAILRHPEPGSWTLRDAAGAEHRLAIAPRLHLSSLAMIRDAALAGAGVARLPLSLVSQACAEGVLVSWGTVPGSEIALWALYPSRRLLSARVAAFLEHLRQSFPTGAPEELARFQAAHA
ncbi:LysR family transcriptional regulator [Sphingomonas morindae]|uniref:LysR family transcriptional regulator n=1 Tax=Sphingomonas morindae TaxID=1541170 RepID=A0ABY4XDC7_9SPHN|nr:LysR family transcriptional regulator [Sphingomonas morindae]USI74979.1 LysR family transcriptional regulator [Sphingomonas morindae]